MKTIIQYAILNNNIQVITFRKYINLRLTNFLGEHLC